MQDDGASIDGRRKELQASASDTSAHVRNIFFFFLTYGFYLAVTAGATTHEQLLRSAPVSLPILSVEIPLFGFYWIAPAVFVLLHLNLMLQFYLLARKLRAFEQALSSLSMAEQTEYLSRLDTFAFAHMLIGRHHSGLFRTLFRLIVWITMIILPVVLLLGVQVRFLPYHDAATTMFHRVLVVLDLALLWVIWRRVVSGPNVASSADRPDAINRVLRMLRRWWRALPLRDTGFAALTLLVGLSSLFLFTFPGDPSDEIGDPLEELLLGWLPADSIFVTRDHSYLPPVFGPTSYVFETFSAFLSRNLRVTETNLVTAWPTKEQVEEFGEDEAWQNFGGTVGLRGRDLRYGAFVAPTLVHADLRDANLQGAFLVFANLQGASLGSANLQGALLDSANLQGASLERANLQGALLDSANLQGADLRGNANLQGVDLENANLQGALLDSANLQGAFLEDANLRGAFLEGANLQGAFLEGANLQGADLLSANLQGADLREARVWQAGLDQEAGLYRLSDWRHLNLDPPSAKDLDQSIETARTEITDEKVRETMLALLGSLREKLPGEAWKSDILLSLADRDDVLFEPVPPPTFKEFDPQLAKFLIRLACADDAPPSVAERIGWRAVLGEDGRLYPALVAKALLDTESCLSAKELRDDLVASLEKLRDASDESEPEAVPEPDEPAETPSSPLVDAPPAQNLAPAAGP